MHALVRRAARVEYALLRAPLTVLDEKVVSRLFDEGSPVRGSFERGLGALDAQATRFFAPPARPAPTGDGTDATGSTDVFAPQPQDRVAPQAPAAAASPEPAAEPVELPAEEQEEIRELTEELAAEQEEQHLVGELADNDELRRVQAELRAKHLVEEQIEEHSDRS